MDILKDDSYVRSYIAHINSELQTKTLEIISLKAQLQVTRELLESVQANSQPTSSPDETYDGAEVKKKK